MAHRFDPGILREYDIRGVVGETLFEADATAVGRAFGTVVRRAGGGRVAVGYDGRLTSPMLEAALVQGLVASGVDVVRLGLGPSPMVYFAEATLGVDAAVQVTGSHNPRDHNGFKLVLRHASFFGPAIADLAALAAAGDFAQGSGTVTEADVRDAYARRLLAAHAGGNFRVGWDTGNGAAGPMVERLTALLPGEHHRLFTTVDGRFPNHHPDPTEDANLRDLAALVVREGLNLGVAFDGDGDRIGAVDGRGRVVRGDEILAILAEPVLAALPGAPIVADVKSSAGVFDRIRALGGEPVMWKTGHSNIKTRMKELGAPLAGELSGHIFFSHDYYGFDDALYAAVQLLRAVHLSGTSLAALVDAMPPRCATPELRFPVEEAHKFALADAIVARLRARGATVETIDGARVTTADGWWLLRASNTQAMLTARAEARDAAALERLVAAIDAELAAVGVRRT